MNAENLTEQQVHGLSEKTMTPDAFVAIYQRLHNLLDRRPTYMELMDEAGVSRRAVADLLRACYDAGQIDRPASGHRKGRQDDPTEDEIRQACEGIKARLSPAELERRRADLGPEPAGIPVINTALVRAYAEHLELLE